MSLDVPVGKQLDKPSRDAGLVEALGPKSGDITACTRSPDELVERSPAATVFSFTVEERQEVRAVRFW